jgi:hypothetical protein
MIEVEGDLNLPEGQQLPSSCNRCCPLKRRSGGRRVGGPTIRKVWTGLSRRCAGCGAWNQGKPMPNTDLFIAATALVHGLTLVTHNTRHFQNVPHLAVEDWLAR